jgi:hypothetical protein
MEDDCAALAAGIRQASKTSDGETITFILYCYFHVIHNFSRKTCLLLNDKDLKDAMCSHIGIAHVAHTEHALRLTLNTMERIWREEFRKDDVADRFLLSTLFRESLAGPSVRSRLLQE